MHEPLHGDLSVRVVVDATRLPWEPSPGGRVWRRRLHRVGPPEAGQVTSIVRYEPGARFPAHPHPDGEEILVLEGVFRDEHGAWPAGSYLLNPEGFRHAPFSPEGCLLFVKLRQLPGRERHHVALDTRTLPWEAGPCEGVEVQTLHADPAFRDRMRIERWRPGSAASAPVRYEAGVELLVLDGALEDELGVYHAGTWLRLPAGFAHRPSSRAGCRLYAKRGGFAYLASAVGPAASASAAGTSVG